jgi:hypothetical protein
MKDTDDKTEKKPKEWVLDHEGDDVRGWPVRHPMGYTVGTVSELLVDTESGDIARVKLADGRFLNAHDLRKGNHELFIDEFAEGTLHEPAGAPMPAARPPKH